MVGSYDGVAILGQLPVLLFAYSCHMYVPILYRELRKQKFEERDSKFSSKRDKMMFAMHTSFFLVFAVYAGAASAGYIAFRDRPAHDILQNFIPRKFALSSYVKAFYSITIICSYPVMCFSGAASLHRLLWHCSGDASDVASGRRMARRSLVFRFMRLGSTYPEAPMSPPMS